jgi:hypothetical protein
VKKSLPSLRALSDEILAEVTAARESKLAAQTEKTAAAPPCNTELGAMLYKLSGELRAASDEVSNEDLADFIKGIGR